MIKRKGLPQNQWCMNLTLAVFLISEETAGILLLVIREGTLYVKLWILCSNHNLELSTASLEEKDMPRLLLTMDVRQCQFFKVCFSLLWQSQKDPANLNVCLSQKIHKRGVDKDVNLCLRFNRHPFQSGNTVYTCYLHAEVWKG